MTSPPKAVTESRSALRFRRQDASRPSRRQGEALLWQRAFLALVVLAFLVYILGAAWEKPRPGSITGLGFGVAGATLLFAAALYGVRRRRMAWVSRWRLGRARSWLWLHIYGGSLFLLCVLMHSAFRIPEGIFSWTLWLLSLWVVASGFAGLFLQQWIPRALASGLSLEAHYDRIPELVEDVRSRAEELAKGASRPLRTLYRQRLASAMDAPQRRMKFLFDVSAGSNRGMRELEYLRPLLPAEEKETLAELEQLYRGKLELDAHYTLQWALRAWLWLHVPTSLALLTLVVVHVVVVAYY